MTTPLKDEELLVVEAEDWKEYALSVEHKGIEATSVQTPENLNANREHEGKNYIAQGI